MIRKMLDLLTKDDGGATAAEYALILAIVSTAIAVAAINLGHSIAGAVNGAAATINACGDGC